MGNAVEHPTIVVQVDVGIEHCPPSCLTGFGIEADFAEAADARQVYIGHIGEFLRKAARLHQAMAVTTSENEATVTNAAMSFFLRLRFDKASMRASTFQSKGSRVVFQLLETVN